MRERGELVDWDDDRGFGFVRLDGSRERVFVHIKSIRRIVNRPRIGDRLSFAIGKGRDGRPAATEAEIEGANPLDPTAARRGMPQPAPRAASTPGLVTRLVIAAAMIASLLIAVTLHLLSSIFAITYLVMGIVSIIVYWFDKAAAEAGRWRVSERHLHGIDFAAGIIGGLAAQALLRHKTSKLDFAVVTYAIAALHVAFLAAVFAGLFTLA